MKVVINAAAAKMGGAVTYLASLLRHPPPPASGHQFPGSVAAPNRRGPKGSPGEHPPLPYRGGKPGQLEADLVGAGHARGFLKTTHADVSGDAAVYFEPLSPEDLAKQIEQMVTGPALRARLRAAAVERAARQLRWEDHVRQLVEGAVSLTLNGASNRVAHAREA
jgi:hypothetical protein